jgi:hypothetical protein
MKRTDNMPIWVTPHFRVPQPENGFVADVGLCGVVCSGSCIPSRLVLPGRAWVMQLFLINDWSWFAMMLPITFWYWLSVRWIDNHSGWLETSQHENWPHPTYVTAAA